VQKQNPDFVCEGNERCLSRNNCYTERASLSDLIWGLKSSQDSDPVEESFYHIPMEHLMSNVTTEDGVLQCMLLVAPSNETEIYVMGTTFFQ